MIQNKTLKFLSLFLLAIGSPSDTFAAITVVVTGSSVKISIENDAFTGIYCNSGKLRVTGDNLATKNRPMCRDIKVISIVGDSTPNRISFDRTSYTRSAFTNLVSLQIDTGAGDDEISFRDQLRKNTTITVNGGEGADILKIDNRVFSETISQFPLRATAIAEYLILQPAKPYQYSILPVNIEQVKLYGSAGKDIIDLHASSLTSTFLIVAGEGNDILTGSPNKDSIYGEGGNDFIHGEAGGDYILGGLGNDRIFGDDGADSLFGGSGDDVILTGTSADRASGDEGDDKLIGDNAQDRLDGGTGSNRCTGLRQFTNC